jgi:hypothetical protein
MRRTQVEVAASEDPDLQAIASGLKTAIDNLEESVKWLFANFQKDINAPYAVAVDMLMLAGYVCGGWHMARAGLIARNHLDAGNDDGGFYRTKLITARFYVEHVLPRTQGHLTAVKAGPESTMALAEDMF